MHEDRQLHLRKPVQSPLGKDIDKSRKYFLKKIRSIVDDLLLFIDSTRFIELCDATHVHV